MTGRIGLDWQFADASMVYGLFRRDYKPGGFNPAVSDQFQGDISFHLSVRYNFGA